MLSALKGRVTTASGDADAKEEDWGSVSLVRYVGSIASDKSKHTVRWV